MVLDAEVPEFRQPTTRKRFSRRQVNYVMSYSYSRQDNKLSSGMLLKVLNGLDLVFSAVNVRSIVAKRVHASLRAM